jgi:hypothetical protein
MMCVHRRPGLPRRERQRLQHRERLTIVSVSFVLLQQHPVPAQPKQLSKSSHPTCSQAHTLSPKKLGVKRRGLLVYVHLSLPEDGMGEAGLGQSTCSKGKRKALECPPSSCAIASSFWLYARPSGLSHSLTDFATAIVLSSLPSLARTRPHSNSESDKYVRPLPPPSFSPFRAPM